MSLPEVIEIIPPTRPIRAAIPVPGSKSITNRALVLAALADDWVELRSALWSEDTQVMTEALAQLGFRMEILPDPAEPCNRTIRVEGRGGRIPLAGTPDRPLELQVGNAGTAARFLAAMVCLGRGCYRLDGIPRMRERPQRGLFTALRQLGYTVEAAHDRLPARIEGVGPRPALCEVDMRESSQFASALLLCGVRAGWDVRIRGEDRDEASYVAMTRQLVERFPHSGGVFTVEPDASTGGYFIAAHELLHPLQDDTRISVPGWPRSGWQLDARFPDLLPLPETLSRRTDLGDSIMTAIVLAPFAPHPVRFTDLGRLRLQECDRVQALRAELTRCGATVEESGDTLTVHPSRLRRATIRTYNDHRMAMCFAILGLRVPGITLQNPACVRKTHPGFFARLSAPPPNGLGVALIRPGDASPLPDADLWPGHP